MHATKIRLFPLADISTKSLCVSLCVCVHACVRACIWGVADPSPLVYNYYYGAPSGISPEMPAEIREPLVCVVCVCVCV